MNRGFLATLFAAAFSVVSLQTAYSAAPVIGPLPDVNIGDLEDPIGGPGGSDSNFFVFTNVFQFSASVSDADTADADLAWSFGEYDPVGGPAASRYEINGVGPVYNGTTAIGNGDVNGGDETAGADPLAPGANQINSGAVGSAGDWASFRDILFSPTSGGSGPFPDPSASAAADAAAGKQVRFYVSDGDNVTSKSIWVTTVDNSTDSFQYASDPSPFEPIFQDDGGFDTDSAWVFSGVDDGPENPSMPTSPDSVDVTKDANSLNTIVRASTGRQRVAGWTNRNVGVNVGADKHLRGKFYIYVSNAAGVAVNQVPSFRARVENQGALHGTLNVIGGHTGNDGPAAPNANTDPNTGQPYNLYRLLNNPDIDNRAGQFLRPSGNSSKPSLYRVNLDPVDVPALAGTNVAVTIESFVGPDPTNGTLSVTEVVVGSYPALTSDPANRIFLYDRRNGTDTSQNVAASGGGFVHNNDLRPGFRQPLQAGQPFDSTPASQMATYAEGTTGLTLDTANGLTDNFTIGIVDITGASNTTKPRFQAGKLYRARFYATSNVASWSSDENAERQGYLRFRFQTALGAWNAYQEVLGPKLATDTTNDRIAFQQLAPAAGSQNPETLVEADNADLRPTGHGGGWYTVISGSPLDPDIRPDVTGDKFGTLDDEPGPGVDAASAKDIVLGVDIQRQARNLKVSDTVTFPYNPVNRANITVHRVELYEYDEIDDGGYAY